MKYEVKNAADLANAIAELERKEVAQRREIQETFHVVAENLKPVNLIKNGVRSVIGEHKAELTHGLFNGLVGIGTGVLGRKLLLGKSTGVIGKTLGKAVQWGMAGLVSKNADKIKAKAGELIDKIFKKKTARISLPSTKANGVRGDNMPQQGPQSLRP